MEIKKIKTILFDFDGTIADTMKKAIEIYNQLALKNNFNLVDDYNLPELRNNKPLVILKKLRIPLRRLPSVANKIRKKLKSSSGEIPAFKGISKVLIKIKQMNYKIGIISTNNIKNIELFLKYNNLHYFDFIFSCREMFGKHRIIKKAIKKNNLSVDEIIYIGDEIRDIDACRKVGIKIISVCWGYNDKDSLVKENSGLIAEQPVDLLEYL
ncbi:MAG: HAD-IA family hydrolase [Spirochaetales bacterium]|nr:HAD-IA family hydrolase [Spirochaetales bacterium]